jgi:flagellar biosynthetic protein FliR
VNAPLDLMLEAWFVVFCRVSACVMTLPALGSERIPTRAKLYVAVATSAPIAIFLWPELSARIGERSFFLTVAGCVPETIVGVVLGMSCRMFMFAIETIFTGVTLSIGLGNAMGAPINEAEPTPALTSWVMLGVTVLMFSLDLHLEFLKGLRMSYDVAPVFSIQPVEVILKELMRSLTDSYLTVFRIATPYLIFGLVANIAVAFLNKMTPQVPVYFAVTPALIFAGLGFVYSLTPEAFGELALEFAAWLAKG